MKTKTPYIMLLETIILENILGTDTVLNGKINKC